VAFEVRQRPRGIVGSGTEPDGSGSREGLRLFERDRRFEPGHGGGARVGNPRWARILAITAGSSMAAMIAMGPPQCGQWAMTASAQGPLRPGTQAETLS